MKDEKKASALDMRIESAGELNEFLVRFWNAARELSDAYAIAEMACRLVVEKLGVERAYWAELDWGTREYVIGASFHIPEISVIDGRFPLDAWEPFTSFHLAGTPVVVNDTQSDSRIPTEVKEGYARIEVGADLATPVLDGGQLSCTLAVNQRLPREWTVQEVAFVQGIARFCWAEVQRARAEHLLRESEERQTFLLKLSDALRAEADARGVANRALELLRDYLHLDRCYITYYRPAEDLAEFPYQVGNDTVPPLPATVRLSDFPDAYEQVLERTFVIQDDYERRGLSEAERANSKSLGMRAIVASTIRRGERSPLSSMAAVSSRPRRWTSAEIALVEETAERTWAAIERARAEAALRESEQNLHLVANIVPDLLWYSEPDGSTPWYNDRWLAYTGQKLEQATGWGWVDAIHPDDRETSAKRYREAVEGSKTFQQEHRIRRHTGEYRWFLVRSEPVMDEHGRVTRMYGAATDIQDRREAMEAVRKSEERQRSMQERQAFLLRLSDALRPIEDPVEIQRTATRLLGQQLKASRVFYVLVDKDGETAFIHGDYTDGVPRRTGRYHLSAFSSSALAEWRMGRTASTSDVNADPRYSESERQAYASVSTRAGAGIPLIKDRRLVAILGLNQSTPRQWTDDDISLAGEVAERTWAAVERARAEGALRESEERFRQFANASAAGLWTREAESLVMDFLNPALATMYGVEANTLLGDVKHWASLIVPDDRELALKYLDKARTGDSVVHEFRIRRPSDGAFRWLRTTDFPLRDEDHIARIGGIVEDISEAKLAAEHQAILLAELQHRVRNIMAMIRSVARRTERSATSVQDYADLIAGRVMSLARTQSLLTRAANADVELTDVVQTELEALAENPSQYRLSGPQLEISPKAAEVLSLAVHELATNALKYGALAATDGRVSVHWDVTEENGRPWLKLSWSETRTATANWIPPTRRGFGTELVERRVPYELHGRGKVDLTAQGAQITIEFPLGPGASILQTGAPMRKSVFGGSIDMSGEPSLHGSRILVLEDDYLLASDVQSALIGAGAEVIGPFSLEAEAIEAAQTGALNAGILDIHLGHGPSFDSAYALQKAGIPLVFVTGYDDSSIPPDFAHVLRLVKPIALKQLVRGLAQLVR